MNKFHLGALPSPPDARDWKYSEKSPAMASVSTLPSIYNCCTNIPIINPTESSVDFRPLMTTVRNQGSRGSCVAFSASAMKEYHERVDCKINEYFSPEFIYQKRSNYPSEGMYPRDVMSIIRKFGIPTEKTYPYTTGNPDSSGITSNAYSEAVKYKISNYASISTQDELKVALVKDGPCLITFTVYNFSNQFWKKQGNDESQGGHCVHVVGYTQTGYIIRNSWGLLWGTMGYTIYPYADWGAHQEIWSSIDIKTG